MVTRQYHNMHLSQWLLINCTARSRTNMANMHLVIKITCTCTLDTAEVLNLWYSCHLWHFDQKIVTLRLYFYVTLLTQRCLENDNQANPTLNIQAKPYHLYITYSRTQRTLLCENLSWKYHKIYKYLWSNQSNACE